MATEILRPNAAGAATGIATQYPDSGEHWDKVDEPSSDGDGTYLAQADATYYTDYYNLGASAIPAGAVINSVTVYALQRAETQNENVFTTTGLRLGGTDKLGGSYGTGLTSYQLKSSVITRPGGGTWAIGDLADLQVIIKLKCVAGYTGRCTQVYVIVDYTTVGRSFGYIIG